MKTNREKINALFDTRREELKGELKRMDDVQELVLDRYAAADAPELDLDGMFNVANSREGQEAPQTDACILVSYLISTL